MKKVSIIFHSVCGNTYLIGKEFHDELEKLGAKVNLFRVEDDDFEKLADLLPVANQYRKEILSVPLYDFKKLLESDIIIIGSPTYFGNVSSEMKAFMDKFADYWVDASFAGKKLFAYTCAGTIVGGGDMCLQAINIFGSHMGMINVSVPSNLLNGVALPAYGLLHVVGDNADIRPDEKIKSAVQKVSKLLYSI